MSIRDKEVIYGLTKTNIGWCSVIKGDSGVLRIFIGYPEKGELQRLVKKGYPDARLNNKQVRAELTEIREFLERKRAVLRMALDFSTCTKFQKRVYKRLQRVPAGSTVTYAELARRCGVPRAYRAVAQALAHNPFPLAVPCHRVLRSDGSLGGFSAPGGVRLKELLISGER